MHGTPSLDLSPVKETLRGLVITKEKRNELLWIISKHSRAHEVPVYHAGHGIFETLANYSLARFKFFTRLFSIWSLQQGTWTASFLRRCLMLCFCLPSTLKLLAPVPGITGI
ncbi:hypothetical protein SADUNF_Sadunf05G0161400 [Salix dunnii]|uniref:Uncharacterized protein n=1 Tax=Salix dunnii TaxID=1413687 RepID=A0A835KDD3_9ROSI|nr:hypothetical protein SADUNF_Sadunf05G0161400 [Salix dunnii]